MTDIKIFYSWQSDKPREINERFIRIALEEAAKALMAERPSLKIEIEAGTEGEPGTPVVTETILRRINECDIFVADVTIVGMIENPEAPKPTPNPNVLVEYGFARRAKTDRRILLVMNTAFGAPEDLPFDLNYLRHPVEYEAPAGIAREERRKRRAKLAQEFAAYIATIIDRAPRETDDDAMAAANERLMELANHSNVFNPASAVVMGPKLALHIVPIASPAAARRVRTEFVAKARRFFRPSDDAPAKNEANTLEWWAHDTPRQLKEYTNPVARWMTRLFPDGAFEATWTIGERQDDDPEIGVDGCRLERDIAAMTQRLLDARAELGLDEPVLVHVTLFGAEDVVLNDASARARKIRKPALGLGHITLTDPTAPLADTLKPIFDQLWLASGVESGSPCTGSWEGMPS
jgi:hypothetical protein